MLSLEAASYRYPGADHDSLTDVTLALDGGTLTRLLGTSRAGLSTLCLVLGGLAPRVVGGHLCGTLRIDAVDVTSWPMHRLAEGVVAGLGRPAAQLSMIAESVFEEVAFGPANLGLTVGEVVARTWATLEMLAITELADREPRHLSGGEQQLVVLAGLLAMGAAHVLLDGPLEHLDPEARGRVLGALGAMVAQGVAVLHAEHRRDALSGACDASFTLTDGRLVADDAGPAAHADVATDGPGAPIPTAAPAPASEAPASEAPDIALEGVTFRYQSGVLALDGIDLRIRGGEAVALVGANGSGKTTLAQQLDGLLRPTSGRVLVGGVDASSRSVASLARSVALGFGDPDRQIFARSVAAEVGFGPRQLGRTGAELERAVERALTMVGLDDARQAHPADLGDSRRKLLAIASLLAMECPVLVLDEPTAGLDDDGVTLVERLVASQRAQARTVVVISHDLRFVARSFDRVVRLAGGRVVADGPPATVLGDTAAGTRPPAPGARTNPPWNPAAT